MAGLLAAGFFSRSVFLSGFFVGCLGGNEVVWRTIRLVSTCFGAVPGLSKAYTALAAMSRPDMRIVVRGGRMYSVILISSKPINEMSAGIDRPAREIACIAPRAL